MPIPHVQAVTLAARIDWMPALTPESPQSATFIDLDRLRMYVAERSARPPEEPESLILLERPACAARLEKACFAARPAAGRAATKLHAEPKPDFMRSTYLGTEEKDR